jgi:hypothetical protein
MRSPASLNGVLAMRVCGAISVFGGKRNYGLMERDLKARNTSRRVTGGTSFSFSEARVGPFRQNTLQLSFTTRGARVKLRDLAFRTIYLLTQTKHNQVFQRSHK